MGASPYNPIPNDTLQAARDIYSADNVYIVFGNRAEHILRDLDLTPLTSPQNQPKGYVELLALVNIFQYSEGLTDHQAAIATGQRLDWKYALHLPVGYPGIEPSALCMFRQCLATQPQFYPAYETLIGNCQTVGCLSLANNGLPSATQVIKVNCLRNYLDQLTKAFTHLVEHLAAEYPDWLIKIARPHWYTLSQTNQDSLCQAASRQDLVKTIESITKDMDYLTQAVRSQPEIQMETYPEVRELLEMQNLVCDLPIDQNSNQKSFARLYLFCETCGFRQSMDTPSI